MSTSEQQRATVAKVIVNAWRDKDYRSALLADPAGTLHAAGVALPKGAAVTVLEDRPGVAHVVVPHDLSADVKAQLTAEITAVLPLPDGSEMRLRQCGADEFLLVLPLPPAGHSQLTEDELDLVVGGGNGGYGWNGGEWFPIYGSIGGNGGNGGNGGLP